MSTDRDTTRIVRSWLRADEHESADRVLDAVLDLVDTTPQRRATWWPARRFPHMNNSVKIGAAAAAVLAAAIVGAYVFGGSNVGGPPSVEATPDPTATVEPQPLVEGAEGPGTFTTVPFDDRPTQFTFFMPSGWTGDGFMMGNEGGANDAAILFLRVGGLHSDPCQGHTELPDVPVGSTARELAAAIRAQDQYNSTQPTDVVIDGFEGVQMSLDMPDDLDVTTCTNGEFWVWDGPPLSGEPNSWSLWILDVDGSTAVILADVTHASASSRDEVDQIIQSLQIEP